jgi:sugar lactone lactonase YvrE
MNTRLELIASGYGLVEGPRTETRPDAGPDAPSMKGALWFTDIRGGTVNRLNPGGEVETLVKDRPMIGGLALHADGGLIMSGPTVVHWKDGQVRVLLEQDGVNSFNDLHTDAQGRVYVGAIRADISDLRAEPDPLGEMYRIELDGSITELYGGIGVSNGIGFAPDGRTLYHVDSTSRGLWVHDVDDSGGLSGRRHIGAAAFERGIPDGMCVDTEGNLWVAHVGGKRVVKLDPNGEMLDELPVPASWVTSCAFGGEDCRDLYIVSADNVEDEDLGGCIWVCRPGATGHPTPLARVQ